MDHSRIARSRSEAGEKTMKKFLLGTVGLIALGLAAPAGAADLPARPYTKAPPMVVAVYDWSGFYIGINGGWGSSRNCWDVTAFSGTPVVPAAPEGCHDATGGMVGGQIGYRWQAGSWVFGLEAQGDWADLKGQSLSAITLTSSNRTRIDALGLFTGQVGYAWDNVLWYVKGGAAVTDNRYDDLTNLAIPALGLAPGGVLSSTSNTRWGGAVGTGLEVGFAPNWSAAIEYDHLFMGHQNSTFVFAFPPTVTDNIRQDVDMVTARISYRWGGPVVAR
jgi:outer membrane immunogenic protein